MTTTVEYSVKWTSARRLRTAKLKESVLCGQMTEERAEQFLEEELDQFQITVTSPDMMPFEGMTDEAIRQNTWLTFKKGQKKLNPAEIAMRRLDGKKRIFQILLKFDPKAENGQAYLTADEKEVEFLMRADKFSVKAKFSPSKMATAQGPDL